MDLGLRGAAVCVQGGTKGMGRAAAECFAADGARVAVLARGADGIEAAVARLRELGSPDAFGLSVDLARPETIITGFAEIGRRWGELNTLVNAAGPHVSQRTWDEVPDESWYDAFTLGLMGAVRCARAALPWLRAAEWARIVNVSAMSARSQGRGLSEYTAAKAALNSATKNMSLELAPEQILVNTVSPGTFVSELLRDYLAGLPAENRVDPDDLRAVMKWISGKFGVRADLGRAGAPAEIGPVICFLGSRRNSYMTGANVNVDGGSGFD